MGNVDILKELYKQVCGEEFTFDTFNNRMIMQKTVYLMKEMGTSCGDYSFIWYKHGPYSQTLQSDMMCLDCSSASSVNFSENALQNIKRIKEFLNVRGNYEISAWLEVIASLHYLKKYIFTALSDDDLLLKLVELKSHLSDVNLNKKALKLVKEML